MKKPVGHWYSYLFAFFLIFGFLGTQPVMAGGKHHNKSHKKIAQLKHKIQQKFKDLHKHYGDDDDDGRKHKKKRRHPRIDRANQAGEIQGQFLRCGGDSSGIFVYIVGRSFSALLTPSGDFTLSYVPKGTYSLAFVKDNHVLTSVDGIQVRKNKLTQLGDLAFCPDNDNDGFDESVDCNDNNPNINPDATETCDGEDNNCDGEVDEGCPECTDADNDGFFAQNGCGLAVDCDDHDPTINPNSLEVCDGRDNNCDGQTDEGCPLNCPTGTADCNGDRVDCETDLDSDPSNCGACGSACAQGQTCVNGVCEGGSACTDQERGQLEACFAGCGGDLNCPTTCLAQVSPTCGQAVQLLGLCSVNSGCPINSASDLLSLCVSQSCSTQWEDAFGDFVPGCPLGQTQCGGQCVDLTSDDANCGSCGRACGANQVCSSGICQVQCAPGQSNCNGQCVDLNSDSFNCGGCNVACAANETCNNGTCEQEACPNNCSNQGVCVDGQCNCFIGWSGPDCSIPPTSSCDPQVDCNGNGICDSNGNCSCSPGWSGVDCSDPTCSFPPGSTNCNGSCIFLDSDPNHCGGCNVACPASAPVCNSGVCEPGVVDQDNDGYDNTVDCNDNNPNVNPAATESCNNIDDDCDGQVDEDLLRACGTGGNIGVCKQGTQTCQRGQWGFCLGAVEPSPETCNGKDDDCDGATDEGNPGGGGSCNTGQAGVCSQGTFVCGSNGNLTCVQDFMPSAETCDNLDNNCDGQVDEGGVCQTTGNFCQSSADCGGNPCVDGVCCESSCSGLCEACVQSKTGSPDGVCAPVLALTDPDNECGPGLICSNGACRSQI